jgi:hypothetical protein
MPEQAVIEDRLAAELRRQAGSPRAVDAAAIRRRAQERQPRRWRAMSLVQRLHGGDPRQSAAATAGAERLSPANERTRMMFSISKLIAGSAVLAATVSLVVSGALDHGPPSPAPGAELERTDFIVVSGTSTMSAGASPAGDDSMSDPRVSGRARLTNRYLKGDVDNTGANWGRYTLVNDDGAWEGEWIGFYESPGEDEDFGTPGSQNAMVWASGTGDYEGWTYVANYTGHILGLDVRGLLYRGPIAPTVALGLLELPAD